MQKVTECSGQWRNSGAVEAKKIPSAAGAGAHGGGIGCYCCRCFSRDGNDNAASALTCNERTASLNGIPIEDRVLQSGYRRCGPENDCDRHHATVVLTPLRASLHTCCAAQYLLRRHAYICLQPSRPMCDFAKCGCTVPAATRCPPSSHFSIVIWFHLIFSAKVRGERKNSSK